METDEEEPEPRIPVGNPDNPHNPYFPYTVDVRNISGWEVSDEETLVVGSEDGGVEYEPYVDTIVRCLGVILKMEKPQLNYILCVERLWRIVSTS